jgi:hypothetical protein
MLRLGFAIAAERIRRMRSIAASSRDAQDGAVNRGGQGLLLLLATVFSACSLLSPPDDRPAEIDGLAVLTVSQAIAARDRGATGPIAIGGWFSMAPVHSCPAPIGPDGVFREPNPLELYCRVGDWALAEKPEPIVEVSITETADGTNMSVSGRAMSGPWLQPVLTGDHVFPPGASETWRPVPVVLIGHFGDVRAATCLPELREDCAGRFVVDSVGWRP